MRRVARSSWAGWMAVLLLGVAAAGVRAQQPASPCQLVRDAQGNLAVDPRCPNVPATPASGGSATPSAPLPPAAKRFPFPGEETPAAPASQGIPAATPPDAPAAPASKRFPYPGETEAPPPAAAPAAPSAPSPEKPGAGQPPLQDAGSSGESSSSSSSSSSSPAGSGGDTGSAAAARKNRRRLPPVPRQSPSEREEEDVTVAGFYQNDGNFKGAYDRAVDAVSLDATDPAAHLALAESARKLGKLDQAEREYKQCLALDPVPRVRKVAEKALKEMTGGD